jgi:perosamine synthetase
MSRKRIPWANPKYWGNEERYVLDALQSSWISGGKYVDALENQFAAYCGARYAVVASNGTTALHMAYLALGIGPQDEVIVPGFGFMAAANVALHVGAVPVFCEVQRDGWCAGASAIESCVTPRTKAIVPIHTYGNVCDMDAIMKLAGKLGIHVIEDAAEAIGSKYRGRIAGTIAPLGVYSFHATKTITTGEGGAVVTNSAELNQRMRLFRSHGVSTRRYWHEVAGHNFRLTNLQAAMGCAQLENIGEITAARAHIHQRYRALLEPTEGIKLQQFAQDVQPLVWAIAVELDASRYPQGRDVVIRQLDALGIETRPGFYAASMMSDLYRTGPLPICEHISRQVISLPSSPGISDGDMQFICDSLSSVRA